MASISGIVLLLLYYLSSPPFLGFEYSMPMEGDYFIVNKNLIEMAALLVIAIFPTGTYAGVDIFISKIKKKR